MPERHQHITGTFLTCHLASNVTCCMTHIQPPLPSIVICVGYLPPSNTPNIDAWCFPYMTCWSFNVQCIYILLLQLQALIQFSLFGEAIQLLAEILNGSRLPQACSDDDRPADSLGTPKFNNALPLANTFNLKVLYGNTRHKYTVHNYSYCINLENKAQWKIINFWSYK